MRKRLLIIIICLSLISAVSASAKSVGVFTKISGTVEIQNLYEGESRQAKMGEDVNVSDAIYAHDNARAEVTFHDGNVIRLASETRIEIREYAMRGSESSEVINLLRGKLRNIVKVVFDSDFQKKKGKYEIHTPIAICGVRGTDFFAYHEQKVSGAVFVEGKGYAYSRDVPNEVVTLTAGQQMTARTGREAPKVAPARSKDIERFKKATRSRAKIDREPQKVKESQKPAAKVTNQKQDRKSDQGVRGDKSGGSSSGGGNSGGGSSSGGSSSGGGQGGGSSSGGSSSGSSGGSNSGGGNSGGGQGGGSSSGGGNSGGGSSSGGGNSGGGNSGGSKK